MNNIIIVLLLLGFGISCFQGEIPFQKLITGNTTTSTLGTHATTISVSTLTTSTTTTATVTTQTTSTQTTTETTITSSTTTTSLTTSTQTTTTLTSSTTTTVSTTTTQTTTTLTTTQTSTTSTTTTQTTNTTCTTTTRTTTTSTSTTLTTLTSTTRTTTTSIRSGGFSDNFNDNTLNSLWQWVDRDNNTGTASSEFGMALNISAGGRDTWTAEDEYAAYYLDNISGNFDLRVRILSQTNSNAWAKCGIMIKNDITQAGSSVGYMTIATTPGNNVTTQSDPDNNGFLDGNNNHTVFTYPVWLRVVKVGTTFNTYSSIDGTTYTLHTSLTVSTALTVQDLGLFVTAHHNSQRSDCVFDDFSLTLF